MIHSHSACTDVWYFDFSCQSPSGHLGNEEPLENTNSFGTLKPEIELSENTFQFPKCQIR